MKTVLVTGGAGFLGKNLVNALLEKGCRVKSFDLAEAPQSSRHADRHEVIVGDICDPVAVQNACLDVDTVFHTAALIDLRAGDCVSPEDRARTFSINVGGTKKLLRALQLNQGQRFIYTSSNSVIMRGEPIHNGQETEAYTDRFMDLYTETKVTAEKWVLDQNGQGGVYTCAIRPSGIWGEGDQTMIKLFFEQILAGRFLMRVGNGKALVDNSFVDNLVHGQLLAAAALGKNGPANGQAYFINDGEPVNIFDFVEPIVTALGKKPPTMSISYQLVKSFVDLWQWMHRYCRLPEPLLSPQSVERIGLSNYFSIEKAQTELGYQPLYSTEDALEKCMPYYQQLYRQMKDGG